MCFPDRDENMHRIKQGISALLLSVLLLGMLSCGLPLTYADDAPAVADASQMTAVEDVVEAGMVPVRGDDLLDGDYAVSAKSSSSMFRIEESVLHVADGRMWVTMIMSGTGYLFVYPGTALEAAAAEPDDRIPYFEDDEGRHCFTIPVEALDQGIPCAAFSRKKELWYNRTLLFRADSLPETAFRGDYFVTADSLGLEDGDYLVDVSLSGGSGRAKVASPSELRVRNGRCTAKIVWSSRNYDYMKVDGEKILPLTGEEYSSFEIPVSRFDRPIAVVADTVAMSEPHEIEYTLLFDSASLQRNSAEPDQPENSALIPEYAEHFRVDELEDGTLQLTLGEKERYLLLARDEKVPETAESSLPIIRIPTERIYAASSSVPDLFLQCGALKEIRFTGTSEMSWRLTEIQDALRDGDMLYAGKYSAPDYELLLQEDCDLVIENTMILHNPEVKEKLEALGLPVIIEYSSYEPHPLGRVEWIRLYGLLTGHREEADRFFAEQISILENTVSSSNGKTAAFFYITNSGTVVVRKNSDYVNRMIELAGGCSPFTDLPHDDTALSTVTIQMESFYEQARNADVLIYNGTTVGGLENMDDLLAKSSLFTDFKAVRNGEVWCTEQSMFQQSSATAEMIADLHTILSGEADGKDQLTWLYRIR